MPKDKKDFKCTNVAKCIFRFTSESAIEGPEDKTNLTIVRSNEDKVVEITVKNSANFTLFSARPIKYVIAENSGIENITALQTPPEAPIQMAQTIVSSVKEAVLDDEKYADDCMAVKKYKYNNNSCWMDSVLFALFAFRTDFVSHYILERKVQDIRVELSHETNGVKRAYSDEQLDRVIIPYIEKIKLILNNIFKHGNNQRLNSIGPDDNRSKLYHTESLRKVLQQSITNTLKFTQYGQMDVEEFVRLLFSLFNINNITKNETQTYTSTLANGIPPENHTSLPSVGPPIYQIERPTAEKLLSKTTEIFNLSTSFHAELEPRNYLRRVTEKDTKEGTKIIITKIFNRKDTILNFEIDKNPINDFMILQLTRITAIGITPIKYLAKIYPPLQVQINDQSPLLELNQIIVHTGENFNSGHYVCYFKCNHNWYLYNDNPDGDKPPTIEPIGTHEDLLRHDDETVLKNAYLLFYSNADTSKPK